MQYKFEKLKALIPNVSCETFEDLCAYEALILKWQPHINLIANSTKQEIWQRHILDSAQILSLDNDHKSWLDIGSGGGLPAIVIACYLKHKNKTIGSQYKINLIESNVKKVSFLRQVIYQLQLPATVYQNRIEDIILNFDDTNVITARALASLEKLFSLIYPLFKTNNSISLLFQKGKTYIDEIEKAKKKWNFNYIAHKSLTEDESVILNINDLKLI